MSAMGHVAIIIEELTEAAVASIAIPVDPKTGERAGDPLVKVLSGAVDKFQLHAVEEVRGPIQNTWLLNTAAADSYLRGLLRVWATQNQEEANA